MNRELKTLIIRTKLEHGFFDPDLKIRYTLVDTIEARGIGDVWNECIGEDFMEICLDLVPSKKSEDEIKSILKSLGILDVSVLIYDDLEDV